MKCLISENFMWLLYLYDFYPPSSRTSHSLLDSRPLIFNYCHYVYTNKFLNSTCLVPLMLLICIHVWVYLWRGSSLNRIDFSLPLQTIALHLGVGTYGISLIYTGVSTSAVIFQAFLRQPYCWDCMGKDFLVLWLLQSLPSPLQCPLGLSFRGSVL